MFSKYELSEMNVFERELSIIENKFDYAYESLMNTFDMEFELSKSLFMEAENNSEKKEVNEKENILVRMVKGFFKALSSLWHSITGFFTKTFSKVEPDQLKEGNVEVKDPNKMIETTKDIVTGAANNIGKILNGEMSPEQAEAWVKSRSDALSKVGTTVMTAAAIASTMVAKNKVIGGINKSVDEVINGIGSDVFKNYTKELSKTMPGEDYDAKKKEAVNAMMSLVKDTDNTFLSFLKSIPQKIYISNKFDQMAVGVTDKQTAKEIIGDKKEEISNINKARLGLFLQNRQRAKTEKKLSKLEAKKEIAERGLDKSLNKTYNNYISKFKSTVLHDKANMEAPDTPKKAPKVKTMRDKALMRDATGEPKYSIKSGNRLRNKALMQAKDTEDED